MGFYVERIIIKNRAPFDSIDLKFNDKSISVLTALNGKGKTTILSYIMDAWVEITKKAYPNSYKGKENSYYRVSSSLFDIDKSVPSIVYIRFNNNGENLDYADIRGIKSKEWYESAITLENRISYERVHSELDGGLSAKVLSEVLSKRETGLSIFSNNTITYFPAFRFELPSYLNQEYKKDIRHKIESEYSGYLINPLEVEANIYDITNWIMDVVLDQNVNSQDYILPDGTKRKKALEDPIWENINRVLRYALLSKFPRQNIRYGIDRRNNSGSRLSIIEIRSGGGTQYCPTIFNLSSGELSVISIFSEILRQGDRVFGMKPQDQFTGVVLIDEVDKHLHIQLQKEVLPSLFTLFPNIQFIISSHSPFLSMGLAEVAETRTTIFDLDNNGVISSPTNNQIYNDAYALFMSEKNTYAKLYSNLKESLESSKKPIIITEGKTDSMHLKAAQSRLKLDTLDVDYYEIKEQGWCNSTLKTMLDNLAKLPQKRIVIGMFDRDDETYISYSSDPLKPYKNLGNNVFAFTIPLINESCYGNKISIEHYYGKSDLLKENPSHQRLFLGEEFYQTGNSKDGKYQTKISGIKHKVELNGIIDEKVYKSTDLEQNKSVACSKNSFAEAVLNNEQYTIDFDFSGFSKIFDVIQSIIGDHSNENSNNL